METNLFPSHHLHLSAKNLFLGMFESILCYVIYTFFLLEPAEKDFILQHFKQGQKKKKKYWF